MCSAATPYIKHGLRGLRKRSIFIYPMTKNICSITIKIIAFKRYILTNIKTT